MKLPNPIQTTCFPSSESVRHNCGIARSQVATCPTETWVASESASRRRSMEMLVTLRSSTGRTPSVKRGGMSHCLPSSVRATYSLCSSSRHSPISGKVSESPESSRCSTCWTRPRHRSKEVSGCSVACSARRMYQSSSCSIITGSVVHRGQRYRQR